MPLSISASSMRKSSDFFVLLGSAGSRGIDLVSKDLKCLEKDYFQFNNLIISVCNNKAV